MDTHPLLQGIEPPSGYSFKRALQLADSVGSELVIYIDAIESKHIKRGVATFFFGAEGKFSAIGRPLAQCIHDEMAGLAGVDNRGCSSENSVILGKPHAPAVRVELGNLSDRIDRARLGDRQHINQLADAISRGISRLYELNLPDSLQ